jgi:hypothetical protein
MALQLTHSTDSGITLTDAYHRITDLGFSVASNQMNISLGVYPNAAAAAEGKRPVELRAFYWSGFDKASADNAHTQIYAHLKTLPEFIDAVDV